MNDQIEKLVAPLQGLSALAVNNIEKITELQLSGIAECADVNIQALKSASSIKDAKDLQAFMKAQIAAATAVSEKAQANANTIAQLAQSYVDEAKKIVETAYTKS